MTRRAFEIAFDAGVALLGCGFLAAAAVHTIASVDISPDSAVVATLPRASLLATPPHAVRVRSAPTYFMHHSSRALAPRKPKFYGVSIRHTKVDPRRPQPRQPRIQAARPHHSHTIVRNVTRPFFHARTRSGNDIARRPARVHRSIVMTIARLPAPRDRSVLKPPTLPRTNARHAVYYAPRSRKTLVVPEPPVGYHPHPTLLVVGADIAGFAPRLAGTRMRGRIVVPTAAPSPRSSFVPDAITTLRNGLSPGP